MQWQGVRAGPGGRAHVPNMAKKTTPSAAPAQRACCMAACVGFSSERAYASSARFSPPNDATTRICAAREANRACTVSAPATHAGGTRALPKGPPRGRTHRLSLLLTRKRPRTRRRTPWSSTAATWPSRSPRRLRARRVSGCAAHHEQRSRRCCHRPGSAPISGSVAQVTSAICQPRARPMMTPMRPAAPWWIRLGHFEESASWMALVSVTTRASSAPVSCVS